MRGAVGKSVVLLTRPITEAPLTPRDQQRAAGITMALTYATGALGIGLAFSTVFSADPDLRWACLLAVGVAGVLSFVRHSLLDRGDAARMGWDNGKPNPFQVEVGLANLAWGILAILAVALSWGLAVYSACFLVFGIYMAAVTVFKVIRAAGGEPGGWRPVVPAGSFAALLIIIGTAGMAAVG
jgi:hypothetical protein